MRRVRRNPDLLGDVLLAGAVVGGVWLLAGALSKVQFPTPNLSGPGGVLTTSTGSPFSNTIAGITQSAGLSNDQLLNVLIDQWFGGAGGYAFGLFGSYDPTSWTTFVQKNQSSNPWVTFPSSATPYFNTQSTSYWGGITNPSITGQFS